MVLKLKNILAAILFSAVLISAQEQDIYFTQTNIIDGLPGDHPFRLLEDRYGYIWMTAETGVFRYDGYEYRNFLYDENDPTSFSGEIGGNICEDATVQSPEKIIETLKSRIEEWSNGRENEDDETFVTIKFK